MYKAETDCWLREDNLIHGSHPSELTNALETFFYTRKFCDITLVSGERHFYAHSCVLAAISPYFMGLLRSGMSEVNNNSLTVNLTSLSASTDSVNRVLAFMYGRDFYVDSENVFEILSLADYFLLAQLKSAICDYLCSVISVNDPSWCLQTWRYAELYACKDLYEFVDRYWKTRFYQLSSSDVFGELSLRELESLLGSDDLVATDKEVLRGIIKWVSHSAETRKTHINDLLEYIDLDAFSKTEVQSLLLLNGIDVELSCFQELPDESMASSLTAEPRRGQETLLAFDAKTSMCYIPLTREWCHIDAMPARRKSFKVVQLNGLVYVVGGMINERLTLKVWCYNPETGIWGEVTSMLKTASSLGVAALQGCIYAVGGPKQEFSVQKYDPNVNAWSFVNPMEVTMIHSYETPKWDCDVKIVCLRN